MQGEALRDLEARGPKLAHLGRLISHRPALADGSQMASEVELLGGVGGRLGERPTAGSAQENQLFDDS